MRTLTVLFLWILVGFNIALQLDYTEKPLDWRWCTTWACGMVIAILAGTLGGKLYRSYRNPPIYNGHREHIEIGDWVMWKGDSHLNDKGEEVYAMIVGIVIYLYKNGDCKVRVLDGTGTTMANLNRDDYNLFRKPFYHLPLSR